MDQENNRHVIIIGAGLSGLSAAYELIQNGFRVTIIEAAGEVGGLASSILVEGVPVERFYHFICRGDDDLLNLVYELGIDDKMHWRQVQTSYYYHGKMYEFGTPFDLIKFEPVPFAQRIRFGLNVMHSRYRQEWRSLDRLPAKQWLIDRVGSQAYQVIWDPLLRVKFGDYYDKVSAAWIWHRINRVAKSRRRLWERDSFGYLENGSETVVDALLDKCRSSHAFQIRTGTRIQRIVLDKHQATGVQLVENAEFVPSDFVISTVALSQLTRLLPPGDQFVDQLSEIEYLGVVCMLLQIKKQFGSSFWTNINDQRIAFNGIIEYTNLNLRPDLLGSHLVYIPFYLHPDNERWNYSDDQLYDEYTSALKYLNPNFDTQWVKNWWVSRARYAQAICHVGFADIVPDHRAPHRGLYITDSTQYYPEDRTISAAIRLGRRVARMIQEDSRISEISTKESRADASI